LFSFIEKVSASPDITHTISQSLGPVILRSRVDTFSILNSKVPVKFVQEMINHYNDIFSHATLKLHTENEKRRLARPIVAQQQLQAEEKSNKRSNSLMSFMRPTINTAEELNKWTVNSMMGVFQRGSTTNTTTSPTTSPTMGNNSRSVPLSFGSTITQQESPPSSPSISPAHIKEELNKVMFDGGDDIFDDKKQHQQDESHDTKTEEILNDIEAKPTAKEDDEDNNNNNAQQQKPAHENIDSSFFDDDDDDDDE
jgi:hypothetical protein